MHIGPTQQRLQITFGKFGALKYTGNLDIQKVWERVLRRVDLPILYTQGFNTRPRMQLATALPLGITSECELLDVALRERLEVFDDLPERIMAVAPAGLRVYAVEEVPIKGPPLQTLVQRARYRVQFVDGVDLDELQTRMEAILAREQIIKVRVRRNGRKTSSDMRPLILDLEIDEQGDLLAHLSAGERGNLQPADLLKEMGLGDAFVRVHRCALYLDDYIRR